MCEWTMASTWLNTQLYHQLWLKYLQIFNKYSPVILSLHNKQAYAGRLDRTGKEEGCCIGTGSTYSLGKSKKALLNWLVLGDTWLWFDFHLNYLHKGTQLKKYTKHNSFSLINAWFCKQVLLPLNAFITSKSTQDYQTFTVKQINKIKGAWEQRVPILNIVRIIIIIIKIKSWINNLWEKIFAL